MDSGSLALGRCGQLLCWSNGSRLLEAPRVFSFPASLAHWLLALWPYSNLEQRVLGLWLVYP